jgi:hypothetical protein
MWLHAYLQAGKEDSRELNSQLASGLCSLAELHMASPERDVEDIARQCEPLLQQAREADARSPEPIQVTQLFPRDMLSGMVEPCVTATRGPSMFFQTHLLQLVEPDVAAASWGSDLSIEFIQT